MTASQPIGPSCSISAPRASSFHRVRRRLKAGSAGPPDQRDKHIAAIAKDGRLQWQAVTG